jgi:hypothetical protein
MIDRSEVRGGFGGSLRSMMSPQLQRKLSEQEDLEARELAREQREQRVRAEQFQETAIQAAVQAALEAGETFHPRMLRGERLGHTPSEFIAQRSAQMDIEDAQRQARRDAAIRKMMAELAEAESGDTTADLVLSERAEQVKREDRAREARLSRSVRNHVKRQTVEAARRASLDDTTKIIYATERMRRGY